MNGWMGSSLRYRLAVAATSTSLVGLVTLVGYLPFFLSHQGSISLPKQKPPIKHNSPKQGSNDPRKKQLKKEGGDEMAGHVGEFFESVSSIFRGSDTLPVCDRDIIAGCEREVADAANEGQKNESLMRLSWALVHSGQPEDVNRGIGMLEVSLGKSNTSLQTREKLYLLAVGHYRNGDYTRSRELIERCIQIQPDWRQALTLQRLLEEKTKRDGMIGMAIVTGAFGLVGLVAGGIIAAASSSRKK